MQRHVVIVDLTNSEQEELIREFAFCLMRRDVSILSHKSRPDLTHRVSDLQRTVGPLRSLRIGPTTWIKAETVASIRREFSPATVEKASNYGQIQSFLSGTYPKHNDEACFADRLRSFTSGRPVLMIYEATEQSTAKALMQGLGMTNDHIVLDFPVQPGTTAQQWQEKVRAWIPNSGGIVYASGNSLGRLNVPQLSSERIAAWRGSDLVSAMRALYRSVVVSLEGSAAIARVMGDCCADKTSDKNITTCLA